MSCFHLVDLFFIDLVADAIVFIRYDDGAAIGDVHHGARDVLIEVTIGRCHIVSQFGESRKAGKGDILRAADAELRHPAAPDWDAMCHAEIMNAFSFIDPAAAAGLDIDDLAAAETDRCLSGFIRNDTFIQTDRRLDFLLQRRVVDNVFFSQRLLDILQLILIHFLEKIDILQRIG